MRSVFCTTDPTLADSDGQSNVDTAAAVGSEPERRQSRSLSIIARALGKGLDSRRPSTVAAVFAAATSSLTPTRWSRRASSARPSSERDQVDDNASSLPRRLAANSVTWNLAISDERSNRNPNTMPADTRQFVDENRSEE